MTDAYITTTLSETKAWPYPQLFHGKSVTLLAYSDALYSIDTSTYLATLIDTKDVTDATGATSKAITAGKDWHFIDLYGSWMLLNGACTIFHTGWNSRTWVQDTVTIKTGCVHKEGRVLLGGFSAANFYGLADWQTFWSDLAGDMPTPLLDITATGPGQNWTWWSSFLAPDMLSMFLMDAVNYQSYAASPDTGYTSARPYAFDLFERNEAGMRPMPWRGSVVGYLPMGNGVVCYGDDGVRYMNPYHASMIHNYGVQEFGGELASFEGVLNGSTCRTAFAGDDRHHLMIEKGGSLVMLTPDLQAKRIGYSEWIAEMDQNKILMQHDALHDEFYISDGSIGILYNKDGMSRCPSMPTKLTAFSGGNLYTIKFATALPTTCEIQSEKITSPSGGIECITGGQVVGLGASSNGWVLVIHSRSRPVDDFYSTTVALDARGRFNCAISYLEYRWNLTAAVATGVTLENVKVETVSDGANPGIAAKLAASAPSAASE